MVKKYFVELQSPSFTKGNKIVFQKGQIYISV